MSITANISIDKENINPSANQKQIIQQKPQKPAEETSSIQYYYKILSYQQQLFVNIHQTQQTQNQDLIENIKKYNSNIPFLQTKFPKYQHSIQTNDIKESNNENKLHLKQIRQNTDRYREEMQILKAKKIKIDKVQQEYLAKVEQKSKYQKEIQRQLILNESLDQQNIGKYLGVLFIIKEYQTQFDNFEDTQKDIQKTLWEVLDQKKAFNNELQDIKGNIRIRPINSDKEMEIEGQNEQSNDQMIQITKETQLSLEVPKFHQKSKNEMNNYNFNFEHIFDGKQNQNMVFDQLSELVQSCIDGYNVCIFCYGQTGSGKTYTMVGEMEQKQTKGITFRAVEFIFQQIKQLKQLGWNYSVKVSFTEIYNEQIRCLLQDVKTDNKDDVEYVEAFSADQVYNLCSHAAQHRSVASTDANEVSSRSHSIFQLKLHGKCEKSEVTGTLNLIDLAGSERVKQSKVEGERFNETKFINKSLSSLGDVITALAQKQQHIPYRNSKLTTVLQEYLGGNSKTLMIVNISPKESDYNQTLCSLRFAEKVQSCKNNAQKQKTGLQDTPSKNLEKKHAIFNKPQNKLK